MGHRDTSFINSSIEMYHQSAKSIAIKNKTNKKFKQKKSTAKHKDIFGRKKTMHALLNLITVSPKVYTNNNNKTNKQRSSKFLLWHANPHCEVPKILTVQLKHLCMHSASFVQSFSWAILGSTTIRTESFILLTESHTHTHTHTNTPRKRFKTSSSPSDKVCTLTLHPLTRFTL